MIVDAFLARSEDDLVDFRISHLGDVVDLFVIGEALVSFSGEPREPHFASRKRSGDLPHNVKVELISVPEEISSLGDTLVTQRLIRRLFLSRLVDSYPEATIFFEDVDEIPSKSQVLEASAIELPSFVFSVPMKFYSRFVNWEVLAKRGLWYLPKVVRGMLPDGDIRTLRSKASLTSEPGAHFSQLAMSAEFLVNKFRNYGHQEFNREGLWTEEFLEICDANGIDILGRASRAGLGLLRFHKPEELGSVERAAAAFNPTWVGTPFISRGLRRLLLAQLVGRFVSIGLPFGVLPRERFSDPRLLTLSVVLLVRSTSTMFSERLVKARGRARVALRRVFRSLTDNPATAAQKHKCE